MLCVQDDGHRVWFCTPSVKPRMFCADGLMSPSLFVPHPGSHIGGITCACAPSMITSVMRPWTARICERRSSPFGQMPAMSHALCTW